MRASSASKTPISLAEIFPPEATILMGMEQRDKLGVIEKLVHHLAELGYMTGSDEKAVVQSILVREKLGSTALGNGIAFPHCRSSLTEKFIGVLGLALGGIPFDAVDGEPVYNIFLVLAPLEGRENHYEVLGKIMAIGRDKVQRIQLRGCRTPEAAQHFLQEFDRQ